MLGEALAVIERKTAVLKQRATVLTQDACKVQAEDMLEEKRSLGIGIALVLRVRKNLDLCTG